jgi:hypothetical protein
MKISLDYRNPTPSHCDVAIFINGAYVGTLRLGQEDIVGFQQILDHGCVKGLDVFRATGSPNTPEMNEVEG